MFRCFKIKFKTNNNQLNWILMAQHQYIGGLVRCSVECSTQNLLFDMMHYY